MLSQAALLGQEHRLLLDDLGEHVAHHVAALIRIVEHRPCQSVHLLVVRLEQSFQSFVLLHTLYYTAELPVC